MNQPTCECQSQCDKCPNPKGPCSCECHLEPHEIQIKALESERDTLLQTLAKERDEFGKRETELFKDRDRWRGIAEDIKRKLHSTQIMLKHYEPSLRGRGADNLLWQIEQNDKALALYDEAAGK